jgi:hypothetical protein
LQRESGGTHPTQEPRSQRQRSGHGSRATAGCDGTSGSEVPGWRPVKVRRGCRGAATTTTGGRRYPGDLPPPRRREIAGAEEGRWGARHAVAVLEAGGVAAAAARGGGRGGGEEGRRVGAAAGRHRVGGPGRHPGLRPDPAAQPEGADRRRGGCGSGECSVVATLFPRSRST